MPTETELTQLKIYHASTNAIAEAAISGGQVDPNSIVVTDEIDPAVTSIGNAIGDISLGNGLTITNNILSATGVYDVVNSLGISVVTNHIATLPGLYAHNIEIIGGLGSRTNVFCTLVTNFSTPFDLNSFIVYINNMQATGTNPGIVATGTVTYNRAGGVEYCRTAARVAPGVAANSTITLVYHNADDAGVTDLVVGQGTGNLDLTSLTDAVVQIM